jgi:hypothetical protein
MGKAIENKKKQMQFRWNEKLVLGQGSPPSTIANQRVPQCARLNN